MKSALNDALAITAGTAILLWVVWLWTEPDPLTSPPEGASPAGPLLTVPTLTPSGATGGDTQPLETP